MYFIVFKRLWLLLGLVVLFSNPASPQIIASPVFDVPNNLIGSIQKVVMTASKAIREEILPWKERISKVQNFFKEASETINQVIKNLKMTHDLIKTEKAINDLFLKSIQQIDESDNIINKWKHRWILGQLYWESRNIFEVFEMTSKENYSIMDDEGRIRVILKTLKQARMIYRAMKLTIRRTNREVYSINRTKRELEIFNDFFEKK